jgi:hypothetical protein
MGFQSALARATRQPNRWTGTGNRGAPKPQWRERALRFMSRYFCDPYYSRLGWILRAEPVFSLTLNSLKPIPQQIVLSQSRDSPSVTQFPCLNRGVQSKIMSPTFRTCVSSRRISQGVPPTGTAACLREAEASLRRRQGVPPARSLNQATNGRDYRRRNPSTPVRTAQPAPSRLSSVSKALRNSSPSSVGRYSVICGNTTR